MAKSIRETYGEALAQLGAENERIVVLDADVSGSTRSALFGEKFPRRFFNVGVAEANMNAVACGLASAGRIPFVNTFATFLTSNSLLSARALASYSSLNVKMAGAYAGLSDAFDGASHHSLDDLSIMRNLPGFTVLTATDEVHTNWLVKAAIDINGPVYLRLSRDVFPAIYTAGMKFEVGKGVVLRDGSDVTIFAVGIMVSKALEAAKILREEGIIAGVVDLFSVKPIDRALILESAKKTGAVVVAEEHGATGGLCSAVSEILVQSSALVPVEFVAVNDTHCESGRYDLLMKKYGLDIPAISAAAKRAVARKR